jgi:hypothetical protein
VGFLLVDFTLAVVVVGVAGWNMTPEVVDEFGTLLGPEKTSCRLVGVFSGGRFWPWTV